MFQRKIDYKALLVNTNKTTPENVEEANQALFHATMNLPQAALHCGMTQREMKMTFREYLKRHPIDYEKFEDPPSLSRWEEQSDK